MGCCGKQRRRFIVKMKKAQTPAIPPLTEIPDVELTPRQMRTKKRMVRIKKRQQRAIRIKARQDRKALNN